MHPCLVTAYKLDELARAAEVAPRTVRYYVQRGLLRAPDFRGKDTTYGPEHLLRLQAIKRLQEAHLPLDEIQGRLGSASTTELERLAAGTLAERPGTAKPASRVAPDARPPERWDRIVLAPGVELHVRSDADPEARRIARSIQTQYGPSIGSDHEESSR
jgi:DNA-binding transcriptional MerR regulator